MKNYKIIIIPTNDEIQVGDVWKSSNPNSKLHKLHICNNKPFNNPEWLNSEDCKDIQKVSLYIIDTTAEIKEGDWYYDSAAIDDTEYSIVRANTDINNPNAEVKIICTSNSSLPLPQLSEQSIKTIVEHNDNIEDFDIEFTPFYDECKTGNSKDIANIILKQPASSLFNDPMMIENSRRLSEEASIDADLNWDKELEQSSIKEETVEEAAERYANNVIHESNYKKAYKAFIAGYNYAKQLNK